MKEKVLIVEDQYIEGDYLRQMLNTNDYYVCTLATSVAQAEEVLAAEKPTFVLLDIFLKGKETGIDLAKRLLHKNIPFVYLSANSNEEILNQAKATHPYGFLVKPFQQKDLLVTMEIARYRHNHSLESNSLKEVSIRQELSEHFKQPVTLRAKLESLPHVLQPFLQFDFITIDYFEPDDQPINTVRMLRVGYDEYQTIGDGELRNITGTRSFHPSDFPERSSPTEINTIFNDDEFRNLIKTYTAKRIYATAFDLQTALLLPLTVGRRQLQIWFYSKRANAYNDEHLRLSR